MPFFFTSTYSLCLSAKELTLSSTIKSSFFFTLLINQLCLFKWQPSYQSISSNSLHILFFKLRNVITIINSISSSITSYYFVFLWQLRITCFIFPQRSLSSEITRKWIIIYYFHIKNTCLRLHFNILRLRHKIYNKLI